MKRNLLLSLFAIILLAACKKDNAKDPTLVAKWTLVNTVYKVYIGGSMVYSDDTPGNGTTVDFQSNGTVVAKDAGGSSTSTNYTITGSTVTIDGDTYEIKDLTHSNVTLHRREDGGGGDYDDETINLKK